MRILLLLVCYVTPHTVYGADWTVGSARANITPGEPMQMAGYGSRNLPAEGKLTDLWAKSLYLKDGDGNAAVLITADLVGIHHATEKAICDRLSDRFGLRREQIAINCSHTHTGPTVGKNLAPLHYEQVDEAQKEQIDEYESWLVATVVEMTGEAIDSSRSGSLTWGNGHCEFAVNRRNNPSSDVETRRATGTIAGPYDHDVPVLIARDSNRNLIAVVFGYACHATTLNLRQWSGDYPGYAQLEIEERYPNANALFWAGCGADQNPLPRRSIDLAKTYGRRLAQSVSEVIEGTTRPVASTLGTKMERVKLALINVPDAKALLETAKSTNKYEQARAKMLLRQFASEGSLNDFYYFPVAVWRLGDVRWVFLGGEVVVDYALLIKDRSDNPKSVWVAGYSNDVMAYIPSRRVLAEGGYEGGGSNVYYGLPGGWSPEIEKTILDTVKKLSR